MRRTALTGLSVLLVGIGLGLRHALDADHVVVVSALVQREPSLWRAARIAALWSVGHTVAFLGLGVLIVMAGLRLPAAFERAADLLVAAMLIGFGICHLARELGSAEDGPAHSVASASARPVVIGLVHGLAGSAGLALLAATTIDSHLLALVYLALVALGTMLGMVTLTLVITRPIGWAMRRAGRLKHAMTVVAALLSVLLGLTVLARAVLAEGAR